MKKISLFLLFIILLSFSVVAQTEIEKLETLQQGLQQEIDNVALAQLADPRTTSGDIESIDEDSIFLSESEADALDARAIEEGVHVEEVAPSIDSEESISDFAMSEVLTNPTNIGLLSVVALLLGWLLIRMRKPKTMKAPGKDIDLTIVHAGDSKAEKKVEELEKSKTELIRSDILFSDILDKELLASDKNHTVAPRGIESLDKLYVNLMDILENEKNGFPEGLFSFKDVAFKDQFATRKEDVMKCVNLNEQQYSKLVNFAEELRDRVLKRLGRLGKFKLRKYDFNLACTLLAEVNWFRTHLEKIKPLEVVCQKLEKIIRKDLQLVNRELHDELDVEIAKLLNGLRENVHGQLENIRAHLDFLNYWMTLEKRVFAGKNEGYKSKYKTFVMHRQFSNELKSEDAQEQFIRKRISEIKLKRTQEDTGVCLTEEQVRRLKNVDIKDYQIEIDEMVGDILEIVGKKELHFKYGTNLSSVTIDDMKEKHFCIRHKKKVIQKEKKSA